MSVSFVREESMMKKKLCGWHCGDKLKRFKKRQKEKNSKRLKFQEKKGFYGGPNMDRPGLKYGE